MRVFSFVLFFLVAFVSAGAALSQESSSRGELVYRASEFATSSATSSPFVATSTMETDPVPPVFRVTHVSPPEPLRAIYMTSCVASDRAWRSNLANFIDETTLNAVVIDIKDYTGKISFDAEDDRFPLHVRGCHVPDMKQFIGELHEKNIYVIGRVTVMQDATYPSLHPDDAVKRKSDGGIWKDRKGLTFVDPGAEGYWKYMVDLSKISYEIGFDEINFDYIRYPSDGNMTDIAFPRSGTSTKREVMRRFHTYIGEEMRKEGIKSSADIFGMTTTNTDDLNIGQIIEHALLAYDYVAPMVYPSHYPPTFNGWNNPNDVPGPVVGFAMKSAVLRAHALEKEVAIEEGIYPKSPGTTTPLFVPTGKYAKKLRTWIQDFDYGGDYDETDVRAQISASVDAGVPSYMVWDPGNRYTRSAFDKNEVQ